MKNIFRSCARSDWQQSFNIFRIFGRGPHGKPEFTVTGRFSRKETGIPNCRPFLAQTGESPAFLVVSREKPREIRNTDVLPPKIAEILRFSLAAAAANGKSEFSMESANFPRFPRNYDEKSGFPVVFRQG